MSNLIEAAIYRGDRSFTVEMVEAKAPGPGEAAVREKGKYGFRITEPVFNRLFPVREQSASRSFIEDYRNPQEMVE